MGRPKKHLRNARQALLAVIAFALVPAALEAAGIGFRNDAPYPVYLQGSIIVNGQIKRGPLLLIKPGQIAWDVNLTKGNHTISIYSTANHKLFQDAHIFPGKDQFYSIVPVLVPRGQSPRVDLKELPVPKVK